MEISLGKGSKLRLKRIQQLKNLSEETAVEYAIATAWLVLENRETRRRIEEGKKDLPVAKGSNQDPDNKAPTSGSNKGSDNKATTTGKPVDPNRPKSG
jgi:hypothetical protein